MAPLHLSDHQGTGFLLKGSDILPIYSSAADFIVEVKFLTLVFTSVDFSNFEILFSI